MAREGMRTLGSFRLVGIQLGFRVGSAPASPMKSMKLKTKQIRSSERGEHVASPLTEGPQRPVRVEPNFTIIQK